jgi:hypothetical protein
VGGLVGKMAVGTAQRERMGRVVVVVVVVVEEEEEEKEPREGPCQQDRHLQRAGQVHRQGNDPRPSRHTTATRWMLACVRSGNFAGWTRPGPHQRRAAFRSIPLARSRVCVGIQAYVQRLRRRQSGTYRCLPQRMR